MLVLTWLSPLISSRYFPFHPILSRYRRGMETSVQQSHCHGQERGKQLAVIGWDVHLPITAGMARSNMTATPVSPVIVPERWSRLRYSRASKNPRASHPAFCFPPYAHDWTRSCNVCA
jgi:hypothetical protein